MTRRLADPSTPTALAMVLLERPIRIDGPLLTAAWRSAWPGRPDPTDVDGPAAGGEFSTMSMTLEGCHAGVAVVPTTIPGGELDGPAATAWLWPDAAADVERVGAHVVVFVSGAPDVLTAHLVLTRLVVAIQEATGALGVYWGAASHVVRADVFAGLAHDHGDDAVPVMLWVDFRAYVEDGLATVFTVGLDAFGVMEVEVDRSRQPVGQVRELVMDLATYLVHEGPVLADGDTVGGDERQPIVARHVPSMVGRPGPVHRLEGL